MSTVATAENVTTADAPQLHAVETVSAEHEMHAAEMNRWMLFFGLPALIAAFFVGMVFATGDAWWMGLAIAAIICDTVVLVWLAMSSDTNGVLGDSPAH
jgi:uncharacterized membrane protein